MTSIRFTGSELIARMERAVEKVHERLRRVVTAMQTAEIPFAVVGGNAVRAWVSQVDEAAARITQDVDIAIHRPDLERTIVALDRHGFVFRPFGGVDMFLDGEHASARDAVHVVFSGERVRPDYLLPVPDINQSTTLMGAPYLSLEALVQMKLTSFRRKDQVHLLDMIEVGLIDATLITRLPSELAARLQTLLDDPDG